MHFTTNIRVILVVILSFPFINVKAEKMVSAPYALLKVINQARSSENVNLVYDDFNSDAVKLEQNGINLLWTEGRTKEGVEILKKAIDKEPRLVSAPCHLAIFYRYVLNDEYNAVKVLENAITHNPEQPELYFFLSDVYSYYKHHESAIEYLLKAIEHNDPNKASCYFNLGNYSKLGKSNIAIKNYQEALKHDSMHHGAKNNLILAYLKIGKTEDALKLGWDSDSDIKKLCVELNRRGHYYEALKACRRGIEISHQDPDLYFIRGTIFEKLNRYNNALSAYDRAIAIDPKYSDAFYNSAIVYRKIKKFNLALDSIDKSIKILPNNFDFHFAKGFILIDLDRIDEAIVEFEIAIGIDPNNGKSKFIKNYLSKKK